MQTFENGNPIVIAIYFFTVAGVAMFCMNPVLLALSLCGALLFFFAKNGTKHGKSHGFYLLLFLGMALVNPLVSHNGVTVLFVLNHNPITAEAALYGVVAATMILAVLYWFRSFTQIMTSDKLLYLFGILSPKLALVLSMGLRYVPLFGQQAKKVNQAQTGMGLYKEDNIVDRVKGGLRVFSVMITWALENGVVTADSMTARGYGSGRRTHFSAFRFGKKDWSLLLSIVALGALTCISIGMHAMDVAFYPAVQWASPTVWTYLGYAAYGCLALLPTFLEAEESIRWNYLMSRI